MTDCRQLLADYAQKRSEPAFRELVARYLDLVYSSALRLVDGDAHRAKDVAQIVFANLAKKAGELSPDIMLGGWLHRHTCFVAANTMRGERRRVAREKEAAEMNSLQENAGADFTRLAPLLDETINQLGDPDRTAILLRFFEQKDFRTVGQSLDTSEDAARMRVNRALEKLRDLLAQRGIRTTAGALGIVITANSVQAAPAGLAVTISATALAGTAVTASTTIATASKTIAMTMLQKTLVITTIAVLSGAGVYEAHQAAQLHDQVQTLKQQQAPMAGEIQELQRERDDATNQVAGLLAENAELKSHSNEDELLKLRGEVGVLHAQLAKAKSLSANRNLTAAASTQTQKSDDRLDQAMLEYLGKPVPQPQNLNVAYTKNGLTDALENAAQAVHVTLKKIKVDDSEFPPLVAIEVKNTSDMQKLKNEIKRLKQYKYAGSISGRTKMVMNLIPDTAYPPESRIAIRNRVQLRQQMLYYQMDSGE